MNQPLVSVSASAYTPGSDSGFQFQVWVPFPGGKPPEEAKGDIPEQASPKTRELMTMILDEVVQVSSKSETRPDGRLYIVDYSPDEASPWSVRAGFAGDALCESGKHEDFLTALAAVVENSPK